MSKFKNYLLVVVVLAVAAAIIGSQARAWSKAEQESLPVNIKLSEISRNPHALKGVKVTFECRFAAQGNMFREKDDVFVKDEYENFSVWNSDVKFWKESELKKAYPTLYIAKDNLELINRLRVLERFNKIEITGVVESLYANMPWIRVTNIKVSKQDELDQSMASQITRAVKFIENDEFQKAKICFEIAQEHKTPEYVAELITSQVQQIEKIKADRVLENRRQEAKQIIETARQYAKDKNYEFAATTYGKALKANDEYNKSASIHKEIAGFFIDFYMNKKESELLDYSVNEFKIAQNLIGKPDDDILYALAYIETLKAKQTHNYKQAEELARKCLELNSHHYGGRKLLSDILSCQIDTPDKTDNTIILPVAPKKRIKLPKLQTKHEDVSVKIDDLISEKELIAMENEIEEIDTTLASEIEHLNSAKVSTDTAVEEADKQAIPGLSADDFKDILGEVNQNLTSINIEDNSLSSIQDTELPDFPISKNTSKLPELAL